jgi:hypothetical protein
MKKLFLTSILLISVLAALAGCGNSDPPATSVIDLSHDGILGNGFGNTTDEIKRWQTFTANEYPVLTAVEVKLRKIGSGTFYPIRAELYETDTNGKPAGDPLAYGYIPPDWLDTAFQVVQTGLDYDGLIASRRYAIVLCGAKTDLAHYEWLDQVKVDADEYFGKYNGTSWVDESGRGNGWLKVHVAKARPAVSKIYLYTVPEKQYGTFADHFNGLNTRVKVDAAAANRPLSLAGKRCHAFLSNDATDCIANLPTKFGFPKNVPIVSAVDGTTVIADNWEDLLDGSIKVNLQSAIGLADTWWSGSSADGKAYMNFAGWVYSSDQGTIGSHTATNGNWIAYSNCDPEFSNAVLGIAY